MGELQRFRTELVEWLKEIVPFNRIDQYIRKTREGYRDDPEAGNKQNRRDVETIGSVAVLHASEKVG
jgi:hypothetical protein